MAKDKLKRNDVDPATMIAEYEAKETSPVRKRELRPLIIGILGGALINFCKKHEAPDGEIIEVAGVGSLMWVPADPSKMQVELTQLGAEAAAP